MFGVCYYFDTVCPAVVDGICSDDNTYLSSYFFTNATPTRTVGDGMHYTWLGNGYAWRFFLVSSWRVMGWSWGSHAMTLR